MKKKILEKVALERQELINTLSMVQAKDVSCKKVMIIDDCEDSLRLIRKQLADVPKLEIETYDNEISAIRRFLEESPDVVLIDIELEAMKGFDLGMIFRNLSLFRIPIIYISANDKYGKKLGKYGMDEEHFVKKPIQKDKMLKNINLAIAETKSIA